VDCNLIFASDEIDRPASEPPLKWEQIPQNIQVLEINVM
jgi:hypothetical protein